jgi:hypothetical protein
MGVSISYNLLTNTLRGMGFELNPYVPCMANCMIEGKQCTIAWYVDDTKILHVNPDVVSMIIDEMEDVFDKMTVTRGKKHTFLYMHVRFSEDKGMITMNSYLTEAIQECGLDVTRAST